MSLFALEERWLDPDIKVFSDYWDSGWENDNDDEE